MYVDDAKVEAGFQIDNLEQIAETMRYLTIVGERLVTHAEHSGSDDVLSRIRMLRAAINAVNAAPDLQVIEVQHSRERLAVAVLGGGHV